MVPAGLPWHGLRTLCDCETACGRRLVLETWVVAQLGYSSQLPPIQGLGKGHGSREGAGLNP